VVRPRRLRGELGGLPDRAVVQLHALERLLGLTRAQVGRADAGESDAGAADLAVVERHLDGDARGREIADLALELEVGAAGTRPRTGHAHLGDDLGRLERRREGSLEELVERDRPVALRPAR